MIRELPKTEPQNSKVKTLGELKEHNCRLGNNACEFREIDKCTFPKPCRFQKTTSEAVKPNDEISHACKGTCSGYSAGYAEGLKAGKYDAMKLRDAVQNYLKERDTAFPDYVTMMQRRKELGRVIEAFDKGGDDEA